MRNFEERKAEIFRRSEERIKERERIRRATIVSCASLAVCVTVFSAALLPGMPTKKEAAQLDGNAAEIGDVADIGTHGTSNAAESELTGSAEQSLVCIYKLAEISSADDETMSYRRIEDADDIVQIWFLLSEDTDLFSSVTPKPDMSDQASHKDETRSDEISYTITLTTHDGETEVYTLVGNTLTDGNGNTAVLGDEQLDALTAALGIRN